MTRIHKIVLLLFLTAGILLVSACSSNNEVDFAKKYKVDVSGAADISQKLQQAINELPADGTLYLQDGVYPLSTTLALKGDMTLKLSDNAVLLNQSSETDPTMVLNHPLKHDKAEGSSNIIIEGGIWDMNGRLDADGNPINLPGMRSIHGLALGYANNVTIRNVTFRDCYNAPAPLRLSRRR